MLPFCCEFSTNENNEKYIKVTPLGRRLGGDVDVTRAFGDYMFDDEDEDEDEDDECENNTKKNRNDQEEEEEPSVQFQGKTPGRCHKLNGLICDPYITRRPLNEEKDEFIVVASDGVWKVGGVETTMTNARQYLQKGDCQLASEKLIEYVKNHAQDNLSAIIIGFAEQVVNNDGTIQNPYKFQIVPPLPKFCGSKLRCRFRNSRIKFSSKSSTLSRATSEQIIKPDLALPNGAIITPSLSNPPLQREPREQTQKTRKIKRQTIRGDEVYNQ